MAENNNNKLENGTVRDKIILFLRDGKPKHFTDITKGLTKHDFTINRGLKILIDSNWILKTGKKPKTLYSLDLTRHDVQEYLKRADLAIPDNSNINKLEFDIDKLYAPFTDGEVESPGDSVFNNIKLFLITEDKHEHHILSFDKIFYEGLLYEMGEMMEGLYDKPFKIVISYNPKKD